MRRLATAVFVLHAGCGRIGYRSNDAALEEGRDASIDSAIDAFRFDANTPDVNVSIDVPLPDVNVAIDAVLPDAVLPDAVLPDAPCFASSRSATAVTMTAMVPLTRASTWSPRGTHAAPHHA